MKRLCDFDLLQTRTIVIFRLSAGLITAAVILSGCFDGASTTTSTPSPLTTTPPAKNTEQPLPQKAALPVFPIDNFISRVTLKPFGIYITQKNSPVSPEKFTGYHTGADAETSPAEKDADIYIHAIAEGTVLAVRHATGYGGVIAISHTINGVSYVAIYGHISLASAKISVGDTVTTNQVIAKLGTGYSSETDGERKHLHFALKLGSTLDIKGYVQSKESLATWIDPLQIYASIP